MKKILFITAILLSVITTKSQITLTQADFGNVYFRAVQANDTSINTAMIIVGNPGTNLTWNFDSLHNNFTDTLQFMTVASTPNPFPASFGAANIAYTNTNNPGTFNFGNSSSTGVSAIGIGLKSGTFPISLTTPNEAVVLNAPQTYLNFPSTYNSHFLSSANGVIKDDTSFVYLTFNVDTIRIRHYVTDSSLIDAWGTMTTPMMANIPALRQKFMEWTTDSIDAHLSLGWQNAIAVVVDSSLTYRWFANGKSWPIVEVLMQHNWTQDSSADWIMSSNTAVPEPTNNTSKVVLYPNPASSQLNIMNSSNEESYLYIYDLMGRLINAFTLRDRITTISTADYSDGIYSYRVMNVNNIPVSSGKFNIIK